MASIKQPLIIMIGFATVRAFVVFIERGLAILWCPSTIWMLYIGILFIILSAFCSL